MAFTSVSVLICVTDEEDSLKRTVNDIMALCTVTVPEKIVIVRTPDASAGCIKAAEECRDAFPDTVTVLVQQRPGIGGAVLDAADAITSSHIIGLSGDYPISLDNIPLMIENAKKEPDVIFKNSRHLQKNSFIGYSKAKMLFNVLGQRFLRVLFHSELTDLTSPMQIMPARLYHEINWRESGFPFFLEMVLIPLRLGVVIRELPAKSLPRTEGKSKNSFIKTFSYVFTALRIRFTPAAKLQKKE